MKSTLDLFGGRVVRKGFHYNNYISSSSFHNFISHQSRGFGKENLTAKGTRNIRFWQKKNLYPKATKSLKRFFI